MDKITPVPVDKIPNSMKGACYSFARQIDAAIAQNHVTEQELRTTFAIIEDWAVRQLKLLGGRPQGGASGATTA